MATNNSAEVAFEMYRKAIKGGDLELARIYLLNAITHDSRVEYLAEYVDFLKKNASPEDEEAYQQAYNIMSMAALNCHADDIAEIRQLIADLQSISMANAAEEANAPEKESSELAQIERELETFSWPHLKKNGRLFSASVLADKAAALRQALGSGCLSDDQTKHYMDELEETQWQINLVSLKESLGSLFKSIEEETARVSNKISSSRINALMAQATSVLSQIWILANEGPLSERELREEQESMQEAFNKTEKVAQEVLSQKTLELIKSKLKGIEKNLMSIDSVSMRIKEVQLAVEYIQGLLPQIVFEEHRTSVQSYLKRLSELIVSLSRMRYARYQARIAGLAQRALKKYDAMTMVFEADAINILEECEFCKVDESLLSPEAAGLFQFAKSTLVAKLDMVKRVDFDYKCVVAKKFNLEEI